MLVWSGFAGSCYAGGAAAIGHADHDVSPCGPKRNASKHHDKLAPVHNPNTNGAADVAYMQQRQHKGPSPRKLMHKTKVNKTCRDTCPDGVFRGPQFPKLVHTTFKAPKTISKRPRYDKLNRAMFTKCALSKQDARAVKPPNGSRNTPSGRETPRTPLTPGG